MNYSFGSWDIRERFIRLERKLDALIALVTGAGIPADLKLKLEENMTATQHVKMGPKSGAKKMTGPPIQLPPSGGIGLVLDPIDATGADVVPTSDMAGTLTVDNAAAFVIVAGADSLHYTGTVPAGTPAGTTFTVTAGLTGTFPASPLSATQQFTTPSTPPTLPADLKINVSIGP